MLEKFHDAEKYEFKDAFIERYKSLTDWEIFKEYSLSFLRRSIRVNTLKMPIKELCERMEDKERNEQWKLTKIPWCPEGFWISGERRDLGNTVEHVLGYIYVQESASMIPPVVLAPKPGDVVLDLCAAPGSKTTQMAAMMQNEGILVANDADITRIKALGLNLQRCGCANTIIAHNPRLHFQKEVFTKILVDAPCSAVGTIRKSPKVIRMWSPDGVRRLCAQQRALAAKSFEMLKPGGTMVYSTCTMEPEENEGIVDFLLTTFPNAKVEKIDLDIKRSEPVTHFEKQEYSSEVKKTLRLWPQDNDTEGFFVAKLKKSE